MSNLNLAVIMGLFFISIGIFLFGLFLGFIIQSYHQDRLRIDQNWGEAAVQKMIVTNFPPPDYHLLNNVTMPYQNGTTQIDHILVSTKGIFVIETKHYSGWLFGEENSKQWTQVIYRVKSRFQNPIHQNFLHLKVIEQLFEFLPKEQIHSVVVFTGTGQFRTPIPKGVFYLSQLTDYLKSFREEVVSKNRVEFCVGRLECKRYEVTKLTDVQHRAYLAQKFGQNKI